MLCRTSFRCAAVARSGIVVAEIKTAGEESGDLIGDGDEVVGKTGGFAFAGSSELFLGPMHNFQGCVLNMGKA